MDKKKTLSEFEAISRSRIKSLINDFCHGSQQEFAKRTGLTKGSVSQYVNGKNTPSNLTAQKIAKAFRKAPEWVMGFSVDAKPVDPKVERIVTKLDDQDLYEKINNLSPKDKEMIRNIIDHVLEKNRQLMESKKQQETVQGKLISAAAGAGKEKDVKVIKASGIEIVEIKDKKPEDGGDHDGP